MTLTENVSQNRGKTVITEAKVTYQTKNALLQKLFDEASKKCLKNIADFSGTKVLVEGAGYEKIWLETQPMGGEMYAKRNIQVGLNNQLMFMKHQRSDGRIPGSIAVVDGVVTPQYNKLQGFCFPEPALNMYYIAGMDKDYLLSLYDTLKHFDEYLWKHRDSDGDGCLESWCMYDTGEDNAERYKDAPFAWESELPPTGSVTVPIASLDVMSWSYSAEATIAKIMGLLGNEKEQDEWRLRGGKVRSKIRSYLWDPDSFTCFDRDKYHRRMDCLYHNTLRAMYWGSIDKDMACRFVEKHLLNPEEFFTPMPLPSVAANDPLFRNIPTNNWSGQVEALTYQRAISALENYGYYELIPRLGDKLFEAIGEACVFVQQYDPFTGKPSVNSVSGGCDGYGPALLSVLEYIAAMYGVRRKGDLLFWGCRQHNEGVYVQQFDEKEYRVENLGNNIICYIDKKKIFETKQNAMIITDLKGEVVKAFDF